MAEKMTAHSAENDPRNAAIRVYPVFERNPSPVDTYGAGEAFPTGAFGAQIPGSEIDGRCIGDRGNRPVTERIRGLNKTLIKRETT